eukprot:c24236_g1_i1 orf=130-774(-)
MMAKEGESGKREDVVEISSEPLDLNKYVNAVRDSSAGAIATFAGTTRDTFQGRQVLQLEYEAYEPMAVRQMQSICSAARIRWPLIALACAHRIGLVPIGHESVFVAASSVHRADALHACHFIIDEIKASVPIWKKEVYTDGHVWKENAEFFAKTDSRQHAEYVTNSVKGSSHDAGGQCADKDDHLAFHRTACCPKRDCIEAGNPNPSSDADCAS